MHIDAVGGQFVPPPPPPGHPPRTANHSRATRPLVGVPPPPPPGSPPRKHKSSASNRLAGQSIVEARRKAAMAMYESEDLVVDDLLPTLVVRSPVIPMAQSVSSSQSPNENRPPKKHIQKSSSSPSTPKARSSPIASTGMKRPQSKTPVNAKYVGDAKGLPKTPASTSSKGSGPSSEKSDGKKGFFRSMLGRNKSSPGQSSPNRPGSSSRSPSPQTGKSRRARKKDVERKLGMPLDAKPGSSYKSTPHSAEIVPRKQSAGNSSAGLTVTTVLEEIEADGADVDALESFSPPSFNHAEPIDNLPPSNKFRDTRFPDDISILTDPSYADSPSRKPVTKMEPIGEDDIGADPLEKYWDVGASTSAANDLKAMSKKNADRKQWLTETDAFGDPFFVEDNSSGTEYAESRYEPAPNITNPPSSSQASARFFGTLQMPDLEEFVPPSKLESPPSRDRLRAHEVNQLREAARRSLISDDENSAVYSFQSASEGANSAALSSPSFTNKGSASSENKLLALSESSDSQQRTDIITDRRIASRTAMELTSQKSVSLTGQSQKPTQNMRYAQEEATIAAASVAQGSGVTQRALSLLRKKNANASSPPNPEPPVSPAPKSATAQALDLLRNKDIRQMRSRPVPSPPPKTRPDAPKSLLAIPKRRRPTGARRGNPLSQGNDNEILVPARAPTLPQLAKIAKQGRKPLYRKEGSRILKFTPPKPKNAATQKSKPFVPANARMKRPSCYIKRRTRLIESHVVYIGVAAMRRERMKLINKGLVEPSIPSLKRRKSSSSSVDDVDESKMDPIQRAGYRLLSKAAVPIQTEIRRYLAQREAVDRMWGIIEVQSYFRRWRCEAYLYAHKWAATKIQSAFRGWQTRDKLDEQEFAVVEIQRIVRGYLATIHVYDRFYSLISIQCVIRGWIGRIKARQRLGTIIVLQSFCRRFLAKMEVQKMHAAATTIQSMYRCYSAQLHFQFDIVDIIILQSVVRRWKAYKIAANARHERREAAATVIQTTWRTFQAYSDYVFSIADILVVQRTVRGWLSRRQALQRRHDKQAIKIQTQWRRYKAQMSTLYELVHLIIVQSVTRRWLALKRVRRLRREIWAAGKIQARWRMRSWVKQRECQDAATIIQAAWRRFWCYSHYLILSYEAIRIQSLYRGHRARTEANLQMGCAIIIQSMMRRLLGFKRAQHQKMIRVLVAAGSESLRDNHAARRIQYFWKSTLKMRRELQAAAVIHRFFAMVKIEVDREICRQRDRKSRRKSVRKKGREKMEPDEKILERAWLNTMENDPYGRRSRSNPRERLVEDDYGQTRSVPQTSNQRHHGRSRPKPDITGNAVDMRPFDEMSDVTGPTVFHRLPARVNTLSRKEMSEDLSLEEAWIDTEVREVRQRRQAEQEYLQRHGLQHHGSYQHRDGRHYAVTPQPHRGHGLDVPPLRFHQSPLPHQSPIRHQSPNRHLMPNIHPSPVMNSQARHDMHYIAPHALVPHTPTPQGPFPNTRHHLDSSRGHRSPGRHPGPSYLEKPRYTDPGYYQGGEPFRAPPGGYGRHESSTHSARSPGYMDYQSSQDRNVYYRS